MKSEPVLVANALSKRYGETAAVQDLTFSAQAGEIVGLLGPNGAGKTTAIRVLTTILQPTSGEFTIAGVGSKHASDIRRRIGVLPENPGYPTGMTGKRYLTYHGRLFGLPGAQAEATANALLAEVGLTYRADWRISTYSRGMRQRLGIARALVNDPQIIFLDEPTLGLDPAGQRQVLALIVDIARVRGATVILSTHFLDEVEEVCSRALILNHGTVVTEGTIEEIKHSAMSDRTARFEVPPDEHEKAVATLSKLPGVNVVTPEMVRRGRLAANFSNAQSAAPINAAIKSLVDAGVIILSFEVQGARLSDAFLKITGAEL